MDGSSPLVVKYLDRTIRVVAGPNDGFWQIVSAGAWEPETFAVFQRFIDKEHSYMDIGSWIGPTLLFGCTLAKVAYGIEPDPIAFKELKNNLELNADRSKNVKIFNLCIAPSSGTVSFGSRTEGGDSTSSLLFSSGRTTWTVEALSFADFVQRNQIKDCNFIKIDIEGGEFMVLPTMLEHLRQHRPTLLLSLHPCFLHPYVFRDRPRFRFDWRIFRVLVSVYITTKVLKNLKFYGYLYDIEGQPLTFLRLLRICRGTLSIVATDSEWKLEQ